MSLFHSCFLTRPMNGKLFFPSAFVKRGNVKKGFGSLRSPFFFDAPDAHIFVLSPIRKDHAAFAVTSAGTVIVSY